MNHLIWLKLHSVSSDQLILWTTAPRIPGLANIVILKILVHRPHIQSRSEHVPKPSAQSVKPLVGCPMSVVPRSKTVSHLADITAKRNIQY